MSNAVGAKCSWLLFAVLAAIGGCGYSSPASPTTFAERSALTAEASFASGLGESVEYSGPPATLVGAGDIAVCGSQGAEQTARLLDGIQGTVFTLGDNTYPSGTSRSFLECYQPTWGRHKARTRPAPGNHDYDVPGAGPYFEYFGSNGGDGSGYYSYKLGAWLILSLNSNIPSSEGSPQYEWAQTELASHNGKCSLAYWHHPVITSGPNGDNPQMRSMWTLMARQNVDVVMSGHDHLFERFAPMTGELSAAPAGGVRLFIVGTGGARPYTPVSPRATSEIRASVWGVLQLTLQRDSYEWQFLSVPGAGFTDFGRDRCH